DLRPTFGELREARQEVRRLLEAEDFDRAAFDAAMARVDTLGDTVEARMEKGFADAVGQLSAEDRRRFKPGRPDRGRPDRDRPDRDRMGPPPEGMPPGAPPEPLP
ncbi:MAG: periplasmic heavy metal sensor, partial [Zavarzinia sp.]|nr:periplasmic heavy metal sensor [Zavarzinia sp.]